MSADTSPLGRILKVSNHQDGTSRVVIDNGITDVITIVTHSELLPGLLGQDSRELREHITTRKIGHFRSKQAR